MEISNPTTLSSGRNW